MNFKIDNLQVYNQAQAVLAAHYPKSTNTNDISINTKTLTHLANAPAGSGHDCWLKGILISFDLTAPLYFWKQFQRYHFHDIVSSQSTMHCINKMNIQEYCNEHVDQRIIDICQELQQKYLTDKSKENFLKLIANNPSGFMLTSHIVSNALQEKTIIQQRKNHKLPEWEIYCKTMQEALPIITKE